MTKILDFHTNMIYVFLLMIFLCNGVDAQVDNINIIAIGGGKDDLFLSIFANKCIEDKKGIIIIAAANETCERLNESSTAYQDSFVVLGIKLVRTLVICNRQDAESVDYKLNGYNLFFPGGDQRVFMQRIGNTKLHRYIIEAVHKGSLYVGTSATTACIGKLMISDPLENGHIVVEEGLGLIDNIVFDQHFSQRQREERLKKVIETHPGYKGIGIDERTAVFISNNKYDIIGEGKAHYIESIGKKEKIILSGNLQVQN